MVDFLKKINKHAADTFEPGEQIREAAIVQPRGATKRQAIAGGVGGLVGAGIAAAMDKKAAGKEDANRPAGSWADQFPKTKVYFTVTDRRIVCHEFGGMSGNPKAVLGWVPKDAVAAFNIEKGGIAHAATLTFTDGSVMELDVLKGGGPPERLIQALQAP